LSGMYHARVGIASQLDLVPRAGTGAGGNNHRSLARMPITVGHFDDLKPPIVRGRCYLHSVRLSPCSTEALEHSVDTSAGAGHTGLSPQCMQSSPCFTTVASAGAEHA
jgi:hypothetical protein